MSVSSMRSDWAIHPPLAGGGSSRASLDKLGDLPLSLIGAYSGSNDFPKICRSCRQANQKVTFNDREIAILTGGLAHGSSDQPPRLTRSQFKAMAQEYTQVLNWLNPEELKRIQDQAEKDYDPTQVVRSLLRAILQSEPPLREINLVHLRATDLRDFHPSRDGIEKWKPLICMVCFVAGCFFLARTLFPSDRFLKGLYFLLAVELVLLVIVLAQNIIAENKKHARFLRIRGEYPQFGQIYTTLVQRAAAFYSSQVPELPAPPLMDRVNRPLADWFKDAIERWDSQRQQATGFRV